LNEQEKMIGPMIKQITDKLPPEKRKAFVKAHAELYV